MAVHRASAVAVGGLVAVLLGLIAVEALADKVRCPVCGQVFEEETEVCPDDGTDLRLAGEPAPDIPEPSTSLAEEEPSDAGVDQGDDPKYKRHDQGGERDRVNSAESGYSDRRKRIGEERRGTSVAAERKRKARMQKRKAFTEVDERLRADFAEQREREWRERREREFQDWRAGQQLAAVRQRALWERGAPLTSVGVRLSWMGEASSSGPVTGAEIDVNLLKTVFRVGLSTMIAVRALDDRDDMVFLESLSVGIQRPWRFSPFLLARGSIGALVTDRFAENLTYLVRSVGIEAGLDSRVTESVVISVSAGYVRYMIDDAYWNSGALKISLGF